MSYKSETFTNELNTIQNDSIRQFCIEMLEDAPDYFFTIPASTTGKYHPSYALNTAGLVRHTKALVGIANDLLALEQYNFDPDTKDMIRVAGILHDAKKLGDNGSQWTVFGHPIIAADWVKNSKSETVSQDVKNEIASMIVSHMGSWNTSKHSETILPKPVTEEQKFVHMCDYLASRKHLEYVFEQDEIHSPTPAAPENPDDFIMPFGKYKGRKFAEFKDDTGYLNWLKENCELREPLKTIIDSTL